MPHEKDPPDVKVGDLLYQGAIDRDGVPIVIVAKVEKAGPVQLTIRPTVGAYRYADRIPRSTVDDNKAWARWNRTEDGARCGLAVRLRAELARAQIKAVVKATELAEVVKAWPEVAS